MVILKNPLLLAFERVVALGTLHAAAKEMGLTQVALTKRIQGLEKELGFTLFLRSRRGMSLTEEGKALLQFCRNSHELEGQFFSQVSGTGRREIALTIIGPTSAISTRIAECCQPIYSKHPFLRLHLRSDDHADLIEVLKRGEADLAVTSPEKVPNEMESKILRPDRYLLVASPLWQRRSLRDILENERIIDFYESDRTTMNYLDRFGLKEKVGRSRLFVNENDALIRYFISGVGFGTLTESIAAPYLEKGKLIALNKKQAMEDPLALVWFRRSRTMTYFDDLIRAIQ